jgi:hypothetical protein
VWAIGYFACYAPYSAMAKYVTGGAGPTGAPALGGFEILPATTMASLLGMLVFISVLGWWKDAGRTQVLGISVPRPGRWTFLSGLCTAAIIGTTTLAYTFEGVSIVFMMLLMRGGVLILAPVVDAFARRKVRWFSWIGLALSFSAVGVATLGRGDLRMTWLAIADVSIYLVAYFIRLRFMSRLAKSNDPGARRRYFVEEQMVATPAIVLALVLVALWGASPTMLEIRRGFTDLWAAGWMPELILIGLLSQGTGVFGGLILLDQRENSFCVPVNRASSILSGVVAGFMLAWVVGASIPGSRDLIGASLVIAAIVVLWTPGALASRRAAKEAQAARLALGG